jgi:hypothetical protein
MSTLITDNGKTNTAIPVRITAKDVRFSAKTSCTSWIAIEAISVSSAIKYHAFYLILFRVAMHSIMCGFILLF